MGPWREGPEVADPPFPAVQADAEVIGAASEDLPFLGRTLESVLCLGVVWNIIWNIMELTVGALLL